MTVESTQIQVLTSTGVNVTLISHIKHRDFPET